MTESKNRTSFCVRCFKEFEVRARGPAKKRCPVCIQAEKNYRLANRPPHPSKGKGKGLAWLLEHKQYKGDECLIWPMTRDTKGYARVGINGKLQSATRFMCELTHGAPPTPKHQAGHTCGHGHIGCVHPLHLKWMTNSENQLQKRWNGTSFNGRCGRRSRLTARQIEEIKALKGVVPIMELADRYGVARATIDRWHRIARDGYDFNSVGDRRKPNSAA